MQVKTILNRIQKHRGFVYRDVRLEDQLDGLALTVDLYPHARNRPRCSGCGQQGPQYDRLPPRRFEFVPLWGLRVFFLYMMRRVHCARCGVTVEQVPWADGKHQLTTTYAWFLCARCGVTVEQVPWADGKHQLTTTYAWFLARWAKRLSWTEVARVFHT